jgi:hypothetical protein
VSGLTGETSPRVRLLMGPGGEAEEEVGQGGAAVDTLKARVTQLEGALQDAIVREATLRAGGKGLEAGAGAGAGGRVRPAAPAPSSSSAAAAPRMAMPDASILLNKGLGRAAGKAGARKG